MTVGVGVGRYAVSQAGDLDAMRLRQAHVAAAVANETKAQKVRAAPMRLAFAMQVACPPRIIALGEGDCRCAGTSSPLAALAGTTAQDSSEHI